MTVSITQSRSYYRKALKVIKSCNTTLQLESARRYVNQYLKTFSGVSGNRLEVDQDIAGLYEHLLETVDTRLGEVQREGLDG